MSDPEHGEHRPFVPASANVAEVTAKSFILGCILSIVFAAANTYLGLYAGLTVSASIPAAVLSIGILRGLFRSGTVLEHSIVQNFANGGETAAAGVIFTVPALLISGIWTEFRFWPIVILSLVGSLLGILFMIPLRRAHIVEDRSLRFPEAVACAQVIELGDKEAAGGTKHLLWSMALGSVYKFFAGGVSLFKGSVEAAIPWGKTAFFFGSDISPALLGVGYIVGPNVSSVVFAGGAITWLVGIPIYGNVYGVEGELVDWFWGVWSTKARYLGVGAMLVAGVHSILSVRQGIIQGFKEALSGLAKNRPGGAVARTDRNISSAALLGLLAGAVVIAIGFFQFIYSPLGGSFVFSLFNLALLLLFAFFFSAVASYICGVLGSSNSPVSGMTICAVLVVGGLLLAMGVSGPKGVLATLVIASMVCSACCMAGSLAQDLKIAHLVGATPSKQEWIKVFGSVLPALVIAPVLIVLQRAYGIGTGQPGALKAPQATLFASLSNGLFGNGTIPWNLVFFGIAVGLTALLVDNFLKARRAPFRVPLMALAVGMYLPFTLTTFMFIGGLVSLLAKNRSETGSGVLFASGLIAGESIMGVILGAIIYFNKEAFPIPVLNSSMITLLAGVGLTAILFRVARAK